MTPRFQARHVVVTGASGALGSAVVQALLREGADCHLPSRGRETLDGFDPDVRDRVHLANGVDPTDEPSVTAFYAGLPGLWASIHCIGGFAAAPLADTSSADVQKLMQANFLSPFLCTREAARRMRREAGQGGRIVGVAARNGVEPRTGGGMAAYTASKSALAGLTEALGEELAAEGILVNAVAPSVMDTPANRKALPRADHARWPRVEDVAAAILWLASPENTLVRSAIVPVYGRS
jgi:NAD(P)-dependent dehydrogenase (short-subunit alcohol dehydrogenase family)